jgi:glutamate/tyrosine decarboxylase-like PLP-dependent enzyme
MSKGDLDPKDWDVFRAQAHAMLDKSIDKMTQADQGRVWTPLPDELRAQFETDIPRQGGDPNALMADIMPYGVGNTHPRFFGWVHGAGAPSGVMADMAAAAMNVNAGGRDHVAPVVERQVLSWCLNLMGMPADGSGLIVSGTSMATIIAMKVARDRAVEGARAKGVMQGQLVGYTSAQAHSCIKQAFDVLGLGTQALRIVECNDAFEMDLDHLRQLIAADRAAGLMPLVVVGTAGAVNMGAIDDLEGVADIAAVEDLWFHVDGAFGAAGLLGELARDRLSGISRADSLAFDFHKWYQVNYEAGCVLFRDDTAHRASFSARAEYLRGSERGLAGGAFWAVDYGPELSRGFRALKVWAHLAEHGVDALGRTIDRNIELAQYLATRVAREPDLETMAPTPLNINCFRFVADVADLDALNDEIVVLLQERGIAVPSTTRLNGALAIRVNITNHRTQESDLDLLVDSILEIGAELMVK